MKRSRLKLFKTTSLTISLIAIILIVVSIGVVAYIGVTDLSSSVTHTVNSGSAYESLNQIKADYGNLSKQYDELDKQLGTKPDIEVKSQFNTGKIKLSEVNQSITEIEGDISKGESEENINKQLDQAKEELKSARETYSQLTQSGKSSY
ncbi:MAG: hypothetical protein SOZ23_06545 [Methanosphaera sp.]|uniref:hypothetical protein n=1 Tax=Methanosphaera sp. TaxID=2666342 RepID=UPI0025DC9731|nr:hypothetical protein [Methanosphaera sp.]MCI5867782.1 hypothetical protein [Methanosphaera sp.]MDD6535259.1 hypothetical protein [Methanosphaera sp.]MDY3956420.1 hypothetical protein [Methanosphaera sp.]